MARLIERKFDSGRPVYARKYFISNGRRFKPGDLFDWRRNALTERRAMLLFNAGNLTHDPIGKAQEATPEPTPAPTIEQEFEDQEALSVAAGDDLDAIDDMKELRRIADEIGAPYKVSKVDQRQVIREARAPKEAE